VLAVLPLAGWFMSELQAEPLDLEKKRSVPAQSKARHPSTSVECNYSE
jgi:hypothetical protein